VFEPVWAEDKTHTATGTGDCAVAIVGRGVEQHLLTKHLIQLRSQMFLGRQLSKRGLDKRGRPTFEAKAVVIEGEPGVGKSALVNNMARIARISSITVLMGKCEAIHVLTPFFVWRKIIYDLLFEDESLSPTQALSQLEAAVDPQWLPYLPLLQSIVALPFSYESIKQFEELSVEGSNARIINLIAHIIAERSAQLPMLIIIENGQWIDSSSLSLFEHVQRNICTPLLVFSTRALPADKWEQFNELTKGYCVDHVKLKPLSTIECLDIISNKLNIKRFPDEVLSMITKAQGNPLFCLELVSMLRSSPQVTISNGECIISGELNISMPSTMGALISSRMDLLSASAQTLLMIGSVIGREFTMEQLRYMAGEGMSNFPETLAQLVQQQFVEILSEEGTQLLYGFTNEHIPEVAYSRILVTRRKELHLKIALWLEQHQSDDPLLPSVLAYHYDAVISGDSNPQPKMVKKTVGLLRQAAEMARKQCAAAEATAMLQRAMRLQESLDAGGPEAKQLERSLKLQLVGLPVRKLSDFGWDVSKSPASLKLSRQKRAPPTKAAAPSVELGIAEVQIEGELREKTRLYNWAPAYFVLEDLFLSKYESKAKYEAGKKPLRTTSITLAAIEDASKLTKKPHTIGIFRRNKHTIYLRASSSEDMQAWIASLTKFSQIPTISVNANQFSYAAVVISNERGKIVDASNRLLNMFGYTKEELVGQTVKVLMLPGVAHMHNHFMRNYLKYEDRKLIGKARSVTGVHSSGKTMAVIISLGEFFDGTARRFIASFRKEGDLPQELRLNYKRHVDFESSEDDEEIDWSDEDTDFDDPEPQIPAETDWYERRDSASTISSSCASDSTASSAASSAAPRFHRAHTATLIPAGRRHMTPRAFHGPHGEEEELHPCVNSPTSSEEGDEELKSRSAEGSPRAKDPLHAHFVRNAMTPR